MRGFWLFVKRGLAFRWKPRHVASALQIQTLEDRITPVAFTPRNDTLRCFFAFEQAFSHGVTVASGDVNADGIANVIAGSGAKAFTRVALIDGKTSQPIRTFLPFDGFTGGATVATGGISIAMAWPASSPGPGGGPHVKVFQLAGTDDTQVPPIPPPAAELRPHGVDAGHHRRQPPGTGTITVTDGVLRLK